MTVLTEIPLEFESYLRDKTLQNLPTNLNEFIFAYIPNLDLSVDIDRNSTIPNENLIVHRAPVASVGKTGENAIVYSAIIDSTVAEFTFNAIYLHDKNESNACGMIIHQQDETKQQAMTITKSALMQYDSAAASAHVTVDAETWQVDISDLFAACSKIGHTHTLAEVGGSNPNLFINGDFSVWQRPAPNTSGGYCADKWIVRDTKNVGGVQTVNLGLGGVGFTGRYLAILTENATSSTFLEQRIEFDAATAHYKSHTLSFKSSHDFDLPDAVVYVAWRDISNGGVYASKLVSAKLPMKKGLNFNSVTIDVPPITEFSSYKKYALCVQVSSNGGGAACPNGRQRYSEMKFEEGEVATDFVYESYLENLRKCQFSCNKLQLPGYLLGINGSSEHTTIFSMLANTIFFPTMRAVPSVIVATADKSQSKITCRVSRYDSSSTVSANFYSAARSKNSVSLLFNSVSITNNATPIKSGDPVKIWLSPMEGATGITLLLDADF